MSVKFFIEKKRDGGTHSAAEIREIVAGVTDGTWADYQVSAWLMAAFIRGLNPEETAALTMAMAESGERLNLSEIPKPWVDKHSSGGVGDKTTIVLLPLLAACGLTMVKMSGKGLGITGGTIDKLASVPGLRLDLSPSEMVSQAKRIGIALTGQTPQLAPADKTLYALRDVTATVPSIPLITSSILSKKIAGGAETVILDIKCGSGAFMKTLSEAKALAASLTQVGALAGLNVRAVVTDMDQPLGRAVGNALEVKEAILVLKNEEPGRFLDLCLTLAAYALEEVGFAQNHDAATARVTEALTSGAALAKAKEWFAAQGGDVAVFDHEDWAVAPLRDVVPAPASGFIHQVDAESVGLSAVALGAGRKKKDDQIDPRVGIEVLVQVGDEVQAGQPVMVVHAESEEQLREIHRDLARAISIQTEPIARRSVIL